MNQPPDPSAGHAPAGVEGGARVDVPQEPLLDRPVAAEAVPFVLLISKDRREMEQELLTDPCHLLRRACQIEDYGPAAATPSPTGDSGCNTVTP
jgi:hypothetical protein